MSESVEQDMVWSSKTCGVNRAGVCIVESVCYTSDVYVITLKQKPTKKSYFLNNKCCHVICFPTMLIKFISILIFRKKKRCIRSEDPDDKCPPSVPPSSTGYPHPNVPPPPSTCVKTELINMT